jgi:hypothetical protein
MRAFATPRQSSEGGKSKFFGRSTNRLVDRRSAIMLLCPHAIISQENEGGGHGDRGEGQLRALWNGVQRMQ